MSEKMLIDASHPEETRVVVVRGNRIEEFDFESQHKKQLRGNIYLAKVTRVEPSLQAAFVDYGGNRHGFLAFSEIHPDYYQIPQADRQALLEAEAEESHADFDDDEEDEKPAKKTARQPRKSEAEKEENSSGEEGKNRPRRARRSRRKKKDETESTSEDAAADGNEEAENNDNTENSAEPSAASDDTAPAEANSDEDISTSSDDTSDEATRDKDDDKPETMAAMIDADEISEPVERNSGDDGDESDEDEPDDDDDTDDEDDTTGAKAKADVDSVGSEDAMEEVPERARRKPRKQYRIQEVIKRRQILLVQVVKEERGNKGAALTTYLSLAGRYSVLMPNTARGGGISRKITNVTDRKRLKEIARELEVPKGMGVILRTAGANRTKVEIKRDFEYLMRLWDNVRNLTLESTAPSLVYEEGSLIKRSIRDLYNKDISEIVVAGEDGYREAKDFMKMLMPSHAKVVQPYRDLMPIFARSGIDTQLDKMVQPQVTLKSGGYIIINQTEALVAIDVNSGRSTRESSIEDTALQTNLEAADEVARQLRLRDLAGLIVIDFIDMDENRNNRAVEKKVKDCLKHDRARIQVGRISHFGLLEMSRQRIRASVLESTMQICSHCGGNGHVRSASSVALHVLRGIEEYLIKHSTHDVTVRTTGDTALYMLNNKRDTIIELEQRFGLSISFESDPDIGAQYFAIDRGLAVDNPVSMAHIHANSPSYGEEDDGDDAIIIDDEDGEAEAQTTEQPREARSENSNGEEQDGERTKRRRRRRRRGRRGGNGDGQEDGQNGDNSNNERAANSEDDSDDGDDNERDGSDDTTRSDEGDDGRSGKKRRRGKRGGRKNRDDAEKPSDDENDSAQAAIEGTDSEQATAPVVDEIAGDGGQTESASAPEGEATTTVNGEAPAAEAPIAEEPVAEATIEKAEAKPKRPRRKRTTKAEKAAEEAAAAESAGEPVAEKKQAAEPETTAAPSEDGGNETASTRDRKAQTDLSSIASEPVVTSSTNGDKDDSKSKKGGWWQRRGFL